MKRSELTTSAMIDREWKAARGYTLDGIVDDIKRTNPDGSYFWLLRCVKGDNRYTREDWGMCSTYRVLYCTEHLEASTDGVEWFDVATRPWELARTCIYAD